MQVYTELLLRRTRARKLFRVSGYLLLVFSISWIAKFWYAGRADGLRWFLFTIAITFFRVAYVEHLKIFDKFCKECILPFASALQNELRGFPVYVPRIRSIFFLNDFKKYEADFKREVQERARQYRKYLSARDKLQRQIAEAKRLEQAHAELDQQLIALAREFGRQSGNYRVALTAVRPGTALREKRALLRVFSQEDTGTQSDKTGKIAKFSQIFTTLAAEGAAPAALRLYDEAALAGNLDEQLSMLKRAIGVQQAYNKTKAKPADPVSGEVGAPRGLGNVTAPDIRTLFFSRVLVPKYLQGENLDTDMAGELLFRLVKDRVFGGRYKDLADIQSDISASFQPLYGKVYDSTVFREALSWLSTHGVILIQKQGGTISLSSKTRRVNHDGARELIAALVQFDREFHA